jgi:hypothetical protein
MPRHTPSVRRPASRRGLTALAAGLALATAAAVAVAHVPTGSSSRDERASTVAAGASGATTTIGGRTVAKALFTNPVTPGSFTGLGFDQCHAPSQSAMDAWLGASPYRAVGIYISGASRGCRDQPNLTPTWISTQLAQGWKLLPITLGPQAACNPSFPRYGNDPVIATKTNSAGAYNKAFKQGSAEASSAVAAAQAIGITPGSTLFYDLEGYDNTNTACRESALSFLSAWTQQLHALGYVSGVYSSAGSGIKALDDARVTRPTAFALPDQVWIARWDGQANTSTSYIRSDGWVPGKRVKQFQGGHDEKWGGVTINIDRNYLDLGSSVPTTPAEPTHCNGTPVDLTNFKRISSPSKTKKPDPTQVSALKCLLKEQGAFKGKVKGAWSDRLTKSVYSWQKAHGIKRTAQFSRSAWMTLLAAGPTPVLNLGSAGDDVRRVQRTLNAAKAKLTVTGSYDATTQAAVLAWQQKRGIAENGVVGPASWAALQAGQR